MPHLTQLPKVLVLSGYGLNCEEEVCFAFKVAGIPGKTIHINSLISNPCLLKKYQILAIPGGFSYGDHTGSGNALAWKIRSNLWQELQEFIHRDTLTIGICNGCQILVNLGLVPAIRNNKPSVALASNKTGVYQCRWVHLEVTNNSIWLKNIKQIKLPVAHGEGNFVMQAETLTQMEQNQQIAMKYARADDKVAAGIFPYNPNGSIADIAAITDQTGKVLAMMPHPERAVFSVQGEDWFLFRRNNKKKISKYSGSIKIFSNALNYFV
jgi:phosphoribosylformylglycinamidine synthase